MAIFEGFVKFIQINDIYLILKYRTMFLSTTTKIYVSRTSGSPYLPKKLVRPMARQEVETFDGFPQNSSIQTSFHLNSILVAQRVQVMCTRLLVFVLKCADLLLCEALLTYR